MEMRQVVTGTLAWAGLVVVVAVPAAEALVSHLTQPHAGPAIETIAPTTGSVTAPSVAPQTGGASAAVQVLPPVQPKPVVARLRPNPKSTVSPAPVVASTTAAPAITTISVEKPSLQLQPTRLEASSADKGVAPAAVSAASDLPARIADLPAASKPIVAPAIAAASPARIAPSVADKSVLEESAAAADLPPVATPAGRKTAIEPAPAPAAVVTPSEVHVATTGTMVVASPGATAPTVAQPPAAPPVPMPVWARPKEAPAKLITADDLKGWKSGSLADYLKQQGLADIGGPSSGNSN